MLAAAGFAHAVVESVGPVSVDGDLILFAASKLDNQAIATAKQGNGSTTGIGASFALNVVNDTTTAGIADGTVLNDVDDLDITAESTDSMTTTAEGGAASDGGSAAVSAQAAIAIS